MCFLLLGVFFGVLLVSLVFLVLCRGVVFFCIVIFGLVGLVGLGCWLLGWICWCCFVLVVFLWVGLDFFVCCLWVCAGLMLWVLGLIGGGFCM